MDHHQSVFFFFFFFSSRRRHTRSFGDWSSDVCSSDLVNQAIYLLTTGAREAAFRNIKTIAECLADELINAAKRSSNSYAIKKKDEIERVAKARSEERR